MVNLNVLGLFHFLFLNCSFPIFENIKMKIQSCTDYSTENISVEDWMRLHSVLGAQKMLHFYIISRDQTQPDFVIFKLCYLLLLPKDYLFQIFNIQSNLTLKLYLVYRELTHSPAWLYDNIINFNVSINFFMI
jgi:hypothetical protein